MDASFFRSGERYTLRLERRLAHAPEKVWRMLTERELIRQWFPADIEGEWRVGAPLRFTMLLGEADGLSEEELRGEVLTVEPLRRLEFRWGQHLIRVELTADREGCILRFSETFDGTSWGARAAAGWEMCLENLTTLLQGGTSASFAWDAWRTKFERYVAKFEPDLGHQEGPPEGLHPDAS